jgi:hypothetical protein
MSGAVSVAGSGTLPAGVLEGADGFGLKARGPPTCLDNSPTVILMQVCPFVSRHRICRLFAVAGFSHFTKADHLGSGGTLSTHVDVEPTRGRQGSIGAAP